MCIIYSSGADVQISKRGVYAPGTTNRLITIKGSPREVKSALYLVQQKIQEKQEERARSGRNWEDASDLTLIRGGNKIWIFKPQVNFDVIPTYKHGGKWFFEFGGHLNPPHLRWSFRFFGDFRPFQRNLYIFINAGLEPKLFEIKSSTQQQSCKAHKIGQFCHQDQPSICLCSRVTDRATTAFQLAPKW